MSRAQLTSTVEQNTGGAVAPYVAGKNAIINGGQDIWQRQTSIAVAANTAAYTSDRWQIYSGNNATTTSRQATGDTTNLPNIQYCARVQRNSGQTSTNLVIFGQSLETVNSIPFAGKSVTFSFYARAGANYSSSGNTLSYQLWTGTGTDQNIVSGPYTGGTYPIALSSALTTTWQRVTATATLASNASELAILFLYNPSGTAGAADYFEVTGVQVELGSVATPFSRAGGTLQGELAACQRYLPSIIGSSNTILGFGKNTNQTAALYKFPVTARVAPTGITTTTVATDFYIYNQSFTTGLPSAISFDFAGTDMAVLATTHTAGSPTIALSQPTMLGISSGTGSILFTGCEL